MRTEQLRPKIAGIHCGRHLHALCDVRRFHGGTMFPIVLNDVFSKQDTRKLADLLNSAFPDEMKPEYKNSCNFAMIDQQKGERGRKIRESIMSMFCTSACLQVAEKVLRDQPVFLMNECAFRFHQPGQHDSHLAFHIDGQFMGIENTTLNFWVPTVDVGETAPGLTFLRPEYDIQRFINAHNETTTGGPSVHTAADLERIYGAPIDSLVTTPVVTAGSAVLFHQSTLHSTQELPGGGDYRLSIEFRIGRRSSLPKQYQSGEAEYAVPQNNGSAWSFDYRRETAA